MVLSICLFTCGVDPISHTHTVTLTHTLTSFLINRSLNQTDGFVERCKEEMDTNLNIRVVVKIRPQNDREKALGADAICLEVKGEQTVAVSVHMHSYRCDNGVLTVGVCLLSYRLARTRRRKSSTSITCSQWRWVGASGRAQTLDGLNVCLDPAAGRVQHDWSGPRQGRLQWIQQ